MIHQTLLDKKPDRYLKVEVIVITRDREKSLRRLLKSLVLQTVKPVRVLIIDNGSDIDQCKKVVREFSGLLKLKLIRELKIGIAHARNRGLVESEGEIIAFIDDDCEADVNWVEKIINSHDKHPEAVAIQGKVESYPKSGILATIFEVVYNSWLHNNTVLKHYLNVLDTKNISFKKLKLKKMNVRFDPFFKRGSDVDFAQQVLSRKQKIFFENQVLVYHWERSNLISFFRQRLIAGRTQVILETKWPRLKQAFVRPKNTNFLVKNIGKNLTFPKRLLAKTIYRFYAPLFRKSYENFRNESALLDLSPVYQGEGRVSVGVITRNRPDLLKSCLFSLFRQSLKPSEVIVVDGSDNKKSKDVVSLFSKKLNIVYIVQRKRGISNARNLVLKNASEKIVGFVDDDCEADVDWVEEMVKAHKKHPDAWLIQGSCLVSPFKGLTSYIYQNDYNKWVNDNFRSENQLIKADVENSSFKIGFLRRKKLFFDEDKKFYYSDDVDLSYQIVLNGGRMYYEPAAVVHVNRRGMLGLLIQRVRKGHSGALVDIKWGVVKSDQTLVLKGISYKLRKIRGRPDFNLPRLNRLEIVLRSLIDFWYDRLFKLSYHYYRSKFDLNVSRLEDNFLTNKHVPDTKKLTLSVMIITKNRPEKLMNLLRSLTEQTQVPESIILIDSSGKKITELLRKFDQLPIMYLYEPHEGYSTARNRALKVCNTDLLATVDDDAEVPANWVENIVGAHQNFPNATAIQGRIISRPENSLIAIVEQLHMDKWFLKSLEIDGRFNTISTKNVSFKVRDLKRNKIRFNETKFFNRYGGEDVELASQILSKSLTIRYSAAIYLYHNERSSLLNYLAQRKRKGAAGTLISGYWGWLPQRKFYSFCPWALEPIVLPLKLLTPLKVFIYYLPLLPVYYLAEVAYILGRRMLDNDLEYFHYLRARGQKKSSYRKLPTVTLGVIIDNKQNLKHFLNRISNQTIVPDKIHFYMNENDKPVGGLMPPPGNKIDIRVFRSDKSITAKINQLIKLADTEVLCVLSSDRLPFPEWLETLVTAHTEHTGISIIQGLTIFNPGFFKTGLVKHFNWQTLIRNSMLESREKYWKWIDGEEDLQIGLNYIDINNFSMRLKGSGNDKAYFSSVENEHVSGVLFADKVKKIGSPVTMNVSSPVVYVKKFSFSEMLISGFNIGIGVQIAKVNYIPSQRYLVSANVLKKLLAFMYFAYRRRSYWQLPILSVLYLIYLASFYAGFLFSRQGKKAV